MKKENQKRIDDVMNHMMIHYDNAKRKGSMYELTLASCYLGKLLELDRDIGRKYINMVKMLAISFDNKTKENSWHIFRFII